MKILSSDLNQMETRYRATLINSLSGVKSANLVGTVDGKKNENLSIVSSCFHLGANPALMGLIFRPAEVERHTFENIMEMKFFTLNHVNQTIIEKAHQTSARYPKEISEFKATGLQSVYLDQFKAPFVKEANIKIGLQLVQNIHLEVNKTEFVIGEIKFIELPEKILMPDGFVDIVTAESIGVTGLDSYHRLFPGDRYSYAKPDRPLKKLNLNGQ